MSQLTQTIIGVFRTRNECEQVKTMKITIFVDRNGVILWPATHHTL
jgi:hypothetical protein